jgi:hypothetical protein
VKDYPLKEKFIFDYLKKENYVDITNTPFVDAYINKFKSKHKVMLYGANKCPEIGRILSLMYKQGLVQRTIVSLSLGYSFPNWVYLYSLK